MAIMAALEFPPEIVPESKVIIKAVSKCLLPYLKNKKINRLPLGSICLLRIDKCLDVQLIQPFFFSNFGVYPGLLS